jgi:hypothetical protein
MNKGQTWDKRGTKKGWRREKEVEKKHTTEEISARDIKGNLINGINGAKIS